MSTITRANFEETSRHTARKVNLYRSGIWKVVGSETVAFNKPEEKSTDFKRIHHTSPQLHRLTVRIEIKDSVFIIPRQFKSLIEGVEKSGYIVALNDDWDGDGAIPISKLIYERAINSLISYMDYIYLNYDVIINIPEINPGRDGSIDLDWRCNECELLLRIINDDDFIIHYYGDVGKSNHKIEGIIYNSEVNDDLAHWMKKIKQKDVADRSYFR